MTATIPDVEARTGGDRSGVQLTCLRGYLGLSPAASCSVTLACISPPVFPVPAPHWAPALYCGCHVLGIMSPTLLDLMINFSSLGFNPGSSGESWCLTDPTPSLPLLNAFFSYPALVALSLSTAAQSLCIPVQMARTEKDGSCSRHFIIITRMSPS